MPVSSYMIDLAWDWCLPHSTGQWCHHWEVTETDERGSFLERGNNFKSGKANSLFKLGKSESSRHSKIFFLQNTKKTVLSNMCLKETIPLYRVKLPDGVAITISRKPRCGRHIIHDTVYANRVLPQVNTPVRRAKSSSKKQELSWKVHDAFAYKNSPRRCARLEGSQPVATQIWKIKAFQSHHWADETPLTPRTHFTCR